MYNNDEVILGARDSSVMVSLNWLKKVQEVLQGGEHSTLESTNEEEENSEEEAEQKIRDEWETPIGAEVEVHQVFELDKKGEKND